MSTPEIRSYQEFWPYYVRAHGKPLTRRLHAAGTSAAVACPAAFAATGKARYLLAAPVAGYAPAWFSHFFIEGNVPATFGNPLWSLRADFEMVVRMATGTMDAEVERYCNAPQPSPSTDAQVSEAPVATPAAADTTLN